MLYTSTLSDHKASEAVIEYFRFESTSHSLADTQVVLVIGAAVVKVEIAMPELLLHTDLQYGRKRRSRLRHLEE